jgi:hypothetical protein
VWRGAGTGSDLLASPPSYSTNPDKDGGISMGNSRTQYMYLFTITYYVGGKPTGVATEHRVFDHPVTPEDIRQTTLHWRNAGYERALVISFSLFGDSQS